MQTDNKGAAKGDHASGGESQKWDFRQYSLRFVYGLATINFIAVIQLISANQIVVDGHRLAFQPIIQLPKLFGFVGMVAMSISVPLLVGLALCIEIVLQVETELPSDQLHLVDDSLEKMLRSFVLLGLLGLCCTFAAFHPFFGSAFAGGVLIATLRIMVLVRRLKGHRKSPPKSLN